MEYSGDRHLRESMPVHWLAPPSIAGIEKTPMKIIPPFRGEHIEGIAKILADTTFGLKGSEIGHILKECRIPDTDPDSTKWKRLYNALVARQNETQQGNFVVAFVQKAMKPVRWVGQKDAFDARRGELNVVLAFSGLSLGEDGKLHTIAAASTLSEAESRAEALRTKLESRGVHPDVLRFCRAELLEQNYFHAVLEATKSIGSKVRDLSGLTGDGGELITQAFGLGSNGKPVLAINSLSTDTERGEQRGFTNLLLGLFGTFRNPHAHEARIYWPIGEQDALDILSVISLVHRKLDVARKM